MRRRVSKPFLSWVKRLGGDCCLCGRYAVDLHHFKKSGMGTKCDDYFVCRVCRPCHEGVQGKYAMSLDRLGRSGDWVAMLEDNTNLLADYADHIEGKNADTEQEF